MKKKILYNLCTGLFFSACLCLPAKVQSQETQKKISKTDIEWFEARKWLEGLAATPDPCIDIASFAEHYKKHPERWVMAFKYLKENDLKSLPLGKRAVGDGLTVSVEEYITREPGEEWLEGHKKNIDLQFIVDGCELQGYAK